MTWEIDDEFIDEHDQIHESTYNAFDLEKTILCQYLHVISSFIYARKNRIETNIMIEQNYPHIMLFKNIAYMSSYDTNESININFHTKNANHALKLNNELLQINTPSIEYRILKFKILRLLIATRNHVIKTSYKCNAERLKHILKERKETRKKIKSYWGHTQYYENNN